MRVLEAFETSEVLTNEGLACEIEYGGKVIATVWVRPADANLNAAYRRQLADMTLKLRGANLEELEDDEDREMMYLLYFNTIITKWEWADSADQEDETLTLNQENALALFKRAPKFLEAIQRGARQWDRFRKAHEEDAAGN